MKSFSSNWPFFFVPAIIILICFWGCSSSTGPDDDKNSIHEATVDLVSPSRGMPEVSITLNGQNFGGSIGLVKYIDVKLDVSHWDDSTVIFTLPDTIPPGYRWLSLITSDLDTASFQFLVEGLRIDSIKPDIVNPGDPVKVFGDGFGAITGFVSVNGDKTSITLWQNDVIVFIAPEIYGSCQIEIVKDTLYSNLVDYNIGSVVINSVSPNRSIPGGYVTILGRTLLYEEFSIWLGSFQPEILSLTSDSISIHIPEDITLASYNVYLGSKYDFDVYLDIVPFAIDSIVPDETYLGESVQIYGSFYGTDNEYPDDRAIRFGNSDYSQIPSENWSDSLISFDVDYNALTGSVDLRFGQTTSNVKQFRLKQIEIDSIRPEVGETGNISTVYGKDFGDSPGTISCDNDTLQIRSWTDEKIVCRIGEDTQSGNIIIKQFESESSPQHYEIVKDTIFDIYDCNQVNVELSLYGQIEVIRYDQCDTFFTTLKFDLGSSGETGWKYTKRIVWYNEHFSLDTATLNDPDLNPERLVKWLTGIISKDQTVLDSLYIYNWRFVDGSDFDYGYDRNYLFQIEKRAILKNLHLNNINPVTQEIIFRAEGPELENYLSAFKWFRYGTECGFPFYRLRTLDIIYDNPAYPPEVTVTFWQE